MYVHRSTFLPLPGQAGEVRKIVAETTRQRQAQGITAAATSMVYGPEEYAFSVHMLMRYPDLDSLEKHRDQLTSEAATPGASQLSVLVSPLLTTQISGALAEVILPAPSSPAPTRWLVRAVATPMPDKVTQAG